MAVLIVPSWYRTDSNPTLGSFFREQAMMLAKSGVEVIIVDATFQGRADYTSKRCFRMRKEIDERILTYSYVVPAMGLNRTQGCGVHIFYRNLRKLYKQIVQDGHCIEIIHAHSYLPAGMAAVWLGQQERIPVVVTEHASDVLGKCLSRRRIDYLRETVEGAQAFLCVSNALKRAVRELSGSTKEIRVVYNAVSSLFQYCSRETKNTFRFISIGNLVESKRFDLVICAFAAAFHGKQQIQLEIVGEGIQKDRLQKLTKRLEIEQQVHFTGRLSRAEVAAALEQSEVFVLPSNVETFGVVYVEAMACGVPVIAARNGGAEDIVSENVGSLVAVGSQTELSEAMKKMYSEYAKYDKQAISEECQRKFGEKVITQAILDVYDEIKRKYETQ